MKRSFANHSHREEKPKASRNEDPAVVSRPRTEEDKQKRRREWLIQQERERAHERLKRKMILEYEIRRAREKGLPLPKRRSSHRSRSKSRSKSLERPQRRPFASEVPRPTLLSQQVDPSSGSTPLFKGPDGTHISATELRRIKVDIHRNIPAKTVTDELQRDIVNPEDIVVKRRDGEGSKPIFEREEIKRVVNKVEEVVEHRTVVVIGNELPENKTQSSKRRLASLSPTRTRSHSPRRTSSRHSRHEDSKHREDCHGIHRTDRDRHRSRDRSRERKDSYKYKDRRHDSSRQLDDEYLRRRDQRRDHSRSRDRDQRKWERDSHCRSPKSERHYRGQRERSGERFHETRERERSRERRVPPPHYIEQVPVPVYYGNFPPRPIVVGPMVPIRGQMPMVRGRHPPMMGPVRPFAPRFMPPEMFRLGPPHPRYGPMF